MQLLNTRIVILSIILWVFSPTIAQLSDQITTNQQEENSGQLITPVLAPALVTPEPPVVEIGVTPTVIETNTAQEIVIPAAVQPVDVQPVNVQPVAVQPVDVQPIAIQPVEVEQPTQTSRSFLPQGLANIFQRKPQEAQAATPTQTQNATQNQAAQAGQAGQASQAAQVDYSSLKEGFQQGNLATDFMLLNMEGQTVQLSSLRGRPVILNFWGLNCPPCIEELPILQKADREINGQYRGLSGSTNAHFILVSLKSNTEETKPFLEELGIQMNTLIEATIDQESNLPYTIDDTESVFREYRAFGLPTTFLLDHTGIIQSKRVGAFINEEELSHYLKSVGVNWQPVQF